MPVIAHVSEAGTAIAAALARHAQDTGAAAHRRHHALLLDAAAGDGARAFRARSARRSISRSSSTIRPRRWPGTKMNAELCLKLIDKLPNFAGVVDLSLDWQFMIELMTDAPRLRPGFPVVVRHRADGLGRGDRGHRHARAARRRCA